MTNSLRPTPNRLLFVGLLSIIIILFGCPIIRMLQEAHEHSTSKCECMNVNGTVLGRLKANAEISLYEADGFDYESIMGTIREEKPFMMTKTSVNQSFSFYCLPEGNYLLNVPVSSYGSAVGAPIPAINSQGNLKVNVILQGGDSQNWFSVFSIKRIS